MGRARRARRIAQTAAYGGGFGIAGIGVLGVVGYGLIKAEALLARKAVGIIEEAAPEDDGVYGAAPGPPLELLVLGDSSAAGLGAEVGRQTIGAILATGVSAFAGRRVRLTNVAVVGAVSGDLGVQVANALDAVPQPDAAVILIGTNDITHRIDKSIAVRHLEASVRRLHDAGAEVVVGTCPDLGALQPVAQPLRTLARRWSRDLAAAQTVAVVTAGGRTVSLGDILGPEFEQRPHEMFSHDRFHPSPAGYARAAAVLLPTLCSAMDLFDEDVVLGLDRSRGERVTPVSRAATSAVRDPGTEVSPTRVGGQSRGPLGRWAVVLAPGPPPVPCSGRRPADAVRGAERCVRTRRALRGKLTRPGRGESGHTRAESRVPAGRHTIDAPVSARSPSVKEDHRAQQLSRRRRRRHRPHPHRAGVQGVAQGHPPRRPLGAGAPGRPRQGARARPPDIDDLYWGCAEPSGRQGANLARVVAVLAGYDQLPGATINRFCASSVQTTRMAYHAIRAGEGDVFLSGGVECVSRVP